MEIEDYAIWKLNGSYQVEFWTSKGMQIHITRTEQEAKDLVKLKTGELNA